MAVVGLVTEKVIKAKKHQEDLVNKYNSNVDKSIEQFNKYGNNFDDIIAKYDKLNKAKESGKLDSKQEEEYNNTVKELANILPNAIAYTDANGNAHLKATEAIKKEAEATAKLNAERLKEKDKKFSSDMSDREAKYKKEYENIQYYTKEIKNLQDVLDSGKDRSGQINNQINTMNLEIADSKSKISKQLTDNATKISENTQAWLASKGAMKDVSEAGKGMIDSFAKINQYSVGSKELSDNYTKSQENLRDKVKEFGKAVSESYKQVSSLGGEGS